MPKKVDLTGQIFLRLTVLALHSSGDGKRKWLCKCECGNYKVVSTVLLNNGHTRSCGCYHKSFLVTHGKSNTPEYCSWEHMISRCYNPNDKKFPRYGGRGISVCNEWKDSFEIFYKDMGNKPSLKHTIDRIDNDLNYNKENCKWSTPQEQADNRPIKRKLEVDGIKMNNLELADYIGIEKSTLYRYYKRGFTPQQIKDKFLN